MYSRRKFLLQGGLAATAVIAAKPAEAFTRLNKTLLNPGDAAKSVTIIHSGLFPANPTGSSQNVAATGVVRSQDGRSVYISTAVNNRSGKAGLQPVTYDIIKSEDMKVGVIYAATETASADNIAATLKTTHNCQIVVCVWQPNLPATVNAAFETDTAKTIRNIDVMIATGNAVHKYPKIILNQDNKEVIFQYNASAGSACSSVEIGFDENGARQSVQFDHHEAVFSNAL